MEVYDDFSNGDNSTVVAKTVILIGSESGEAVGEIVTKAFFDEVSQSAISTSTEIAEETLIPDKKN